MGATAQFARITNNGDYLSGINDVTYLFEISRIVFAERNDIIVMLNTDHMSSFYGEGRNYNGAFLYGFDMAAFGCYNVHAIMPFFW